MANIGSVSPNLEGLDFIETEEDVKAVESAALKIQSTFRGKKFRSKLGPKEPAADDTKADEQSKSIAKTTRKDSNTSSATKSKASQDHQQDTEQLNRRVAAMQVNDNNNKPDAGSGVASTTTNPPEDETERAATKIQAGYKGYKTRKELEGKLPSGQQGAPSSEADTKP